jgi:hypothetical protein
MTSLVNVFKPEQEKLFISFQRADKEHFMMQFEKPL